MSVRPFVSILLGHHAVDVEFDADNIPTTAEKAGLAGVTGYETTALNPVGTVSYIESRVIGLEWWKSADYNINYIYAGEPGGVPVDDEKLWDTTAGTMKIYSTGAWGAYSTNVGDRFIFKTDGQGTGGETATDKVYEITEVGPIVATNNDPSGGTRIVVNEESSGSGIAYQFNTVWETVPSITSHDSLTGIAGGGTSHLSVDNAASISSATTPSATNTVVTHLDRDKIPVKYSFVYFGGIAAGQTDVELGEIYGVATREVMPSAGSIVKTTLQLGTDVTAGSIIVSPANIGSAFAGTDLNLTASLAGTANNVYEVVAPGTTGLTFSAGATLSALATTDAGFLPVTTSVKFDIYVVFDA